MTSSSDKKYILLNSIVAHDGPVRCIGIGPGEREIVSGCQSDAPNLRRWRLSSDYQSVEEIGAPIYHDHWVTAVITKTQSSGLSRYPQVHYRQFLKHFLFNSVISCYRDA